MERQELKTWLWHMRRECEDLVDELDADKETRRAVRKGLLEVDQRLQRLQEELRWLGE